MSMAIGGVVALGNVTISGANGTAKLTDAFPDLQLLPVASVQSILFQSHDSNSGKVYIGDLALNINSDAGIIAVLPAPSASSIPWLQIDIGTATNAVPLHQLAVGAAVDGDKIRVTVFTT